MNQQGPNVGDNYRSAIFYFDDKQKQAATSVIDELTAQHIFDKSIATELAPANEFYSAEDYHQNYFQKIGRRAD